METMGKRASWPSAAWLIIPMMGITGMVIHEALGVDALFPIVQ